MPSPPCDGSLTGTTGHCFISTDASLKPDTLYRSMAIEMAFSHFGTTNNPFELAIA